MIGSVILPALISLGLRARLYLSLAGAVLVALGIAFIMGRSAGKEAYVKQRETARKQASQKAETIRHEIDKAPDDRVDRRLDRWMRD
jgi:sensor domain CHASE-containing protein